MTPDADPKTSAAMQGGPEDRPATDPSETLEKNPTPAESDDHQEDLLDEALEETFPGSDPISPKHIT